MPFLLLILALGFAACGGDHVPQVETDRPVAEEPTPATPPQPRAARPPEAIARLLEPRFRDFDEMVEERRIRVLVTFNKTNFFLDGGSQRGIVADILREFEKFLNRQLKLGRRPLQVTPIPVARDQLIPYLEAGRGDLAVASLTITPQRLQRVDFTTPSHSGVSELVVTGPASPPLKSLDDLSGQSIHVRRSSSYWESLEALNASLLQRDLAPVNAVPASEYLETEDLLEMVNAGLVPTTVADDYLARFWAQVLPELTVREDLAVGTGREIAWAVRRDAGGLKDWADRFVRGNRTGKLLGNILVKRYLESTDYVDNALAREGRQRFKGMVGLFRRYGDMYGFDFLLLAAQGYQESGLDQSRRSRTGAVGVMQLLPSTAADPVVGIPDIYKLENNIHAGAKYLRHIADSYFDDPELDELNRTLFAFAGYNAGPSRMRRLRRKAASLGYDPNLWFRNVELVVARDVGREPVHYVSNIYKYYTAYRLLHEQEEVRRRLKTASSN